MFCRHEWELLSKEVGKTGVQKLREGGCTHVKGMDSEDMTDQFIVHILSCKKCGKLKHFRDAI